MDCDCFEMVCIRDGKKQRTQRNEKNRNNKKNTHTQSKNIKTHSITSLIFWLCVSVPCFCIHIVCVITCCSPRKKNPQSKNQDEIWLTKWCRVILTLCAYTFPVCDWVFSLHILIFLLSLSISLSLSLYFNEISHWITTKIALNLFDSYTIYDTEGYLFEDFEYMWFVTRFQSIKVLNDQFYPKLTEFHVIFGLERKCFGVKIALNKNKIIPQDVISKTEFLWIFFFSFSVEMKFFLKKTNRIIFLKMRKYTGKSKNCAWH